MPENTDANCYFREVGHNTCVWKNCSWILAECTPEYVLHEIMVCGIKKYCKIDSMNYLYLSLSILWNGLSYQAQEVWKDAWKKKHQVSISLTFYAHVFCTKARFWCQNFIQKLYFVFEIYGAKNSQVKFARKTLMRFTISLLVSLWMK